METDNKTQELLNQLHKKYAQNDQSLNDYLEGLLYTKYVDYWDYVHLEALLNLQHPKTDIPDEMVFIIYHQITELYFKLTLWELEQIQKEQLAVEVIIEKLNRINQYFKSLTTSFGIMIKGMSPKQFLEFRMALLPASGFQSVQYRKIELCCTDTKQLIHKSERDKVPFDATLAEKFEKIYWKKGATLVESGKKALTLKRFEEKYTDELFQWAQQQSQHHLQARYPEWLKQADEETKIELVKALKKLDYHVNVAWPLVHIRSAYRYLKDNPAQEAIGATGGTNWEEYLPPHLQLRIFFPELWTEEERKNWGRTTLS